jgi:hypothetical protein
LTRVFQNSPQRIRWRIPGDFCCRNSPEFAAARLALKGKGTKKEKKGIKKKKEKPLET